MAAAPPQVAAHGRRCRRTASRYLNVRNTLHSLLDFGAVPIINGKTTTVSVDELKNHISATTTALAAMVTNLLRAPLLIILSDIDGLYDGDPSLSQSKNRPHRRANRRARPSPTSRDRKNGPQQGWHGQ